MAERAVFLDRDNTIIENDDYLGVASQVKLLAGAATALSAIRALGYRLIVVSNQSGVARGMFSESDVEAVNQEMCRQLRDQAGAHIDASYYCPYHPEAVIGEYKLDHDWRKPKAGMLRQAAADFNLELAQCWMIGDQPRDVAAGVAAGCRTILLRDPERKASDADATVSGAGVSPNFVVKTLADAARIIAREGKSHAPSPVLAPAGAKAGAVARTSPAETPPTSAEPAASAAAVEDATASDPTALADAVAQRLARQVIPAAGATGLGAPGKLERSLDELVTQLRHQNRSSDIRPDFSGIKLAALLVQVFAALALLTGLSQMFTAGTSMQTWDKIALAVTNLEHAAIWVLTAAVLQGAVIALLMFSRDR